MDLTPAAIPIKHECILHTVARLLPTLMAPAANRCCTLPCKRCLARVISDPDAAPACPAP
jgi:hypothetical protein